MEHLIVAVIVLQGLALAAYAWWSEQQLTHRLKRATKRLDDQVENARRDIRDLTESVTKLHPSCEVWGVSLRFEGVRQDDGGGLRDLCPIPLGTCRILEPGEQTVDLVLRPPWPGRILQVQVFGGPWLLNRVCVGNKVLSWCEGLNTAIGTQTQMLDVFATVTPGNEITVRLDRPRGMP
jgi:hypothetical protein